MSFEPTGALPALPYTCFCLVQELASAQEQLDSREQAPGVGFKRGIGSRPTGAKISLAGVNQEPRPPPCFGSFRAWDMLDMQGRLKNPGKHLIRAIVTFLTIRTPTRILKCLGYKAS